MTGGPLKHHVVDISPPSPDIGRIRRIRELLREIRDAQERQIREDPELRRLWSELENRVAEETATKD